MGTYLTDDQIRKAREELRLLYSLPYATDLIGTAWEQILADIKGGTWTEMRDNRPRPDVTAKEGGRDVNYSVKTEGLRTNAKRPNARAFIGHHEDLIVARPKVDELLGRGESIETLDANELGSKVLLYYNEHIVARYQWHVLSILLRVESRGFIYWEERPPTIYNPADYWWQDSGRATGGNRNINSYPRTVNPATQPLPRAKFKWTSGGKQFYVLYQIPRDADTWEIEPTELTLQEVRDALREKIQAKKRILGQSPAT